VRSTVQSLVEIPFLLQGTELIATLPERLVTALNATVPLKIFPLPMRVTETREVLVWHKRNEPDPGHAWLREILLEVAREP
jgi:LysR family nod box-dependent transcriptional activator